MSLQGTGGPLGAAPAGHPTGAGCKLRCLCRLLQPLPLHAGGRVARRGPLPAQFQALSALPWEMRLLTRPLPHCFLACGWSSFSRGSIPSPSRTPTCSSPGPPASVRHPRSQAAWGLWRCPRSEAALPLCCSGPRLGPLCPAHAVPDCCPSCLAPGLGQCVPRRGPGLAPGEPVRRKLQGEAWPGASGREGRPAQAARGCGPQQPTHSDPRPRRGCRRSCACTGAPRASASSSTTWTS